MTPVTKQCDASAAPGYVGSSVRADTSVALCQLTQATKKETLSEMTALFGFNTQSNSVLFMRAIVQGDFAGEGPVQIGEVARGEHHSNHPPN